MHDPSRFINSQMVGFQPVCIFNKFLSFIMFGSQLQYLESLAKQRNLILIDSFYEQRTVCITNLLGYTENLPKALPVKKK